jgi:hypothetical protein
VFIDFGDCDLDFLLEWEGLNLEDLEPYDPNEQDFENGVDIDYEGEFPDKRIIYGIVNGQFEGFDIQIIATQFDKIQDLLSSFDWAGVRGAYTGADPEFVVFDEFEEFVNTLVWNPEPTGYHPKPVWTRSDVTKYDYRMFPSFDNLNQKTYERLKRFASKLGFDRFKIPLAVVRYFEGDTKDMDYEELLKISKPIEKQAKYSVIYGGPDIDLIKFNELP